MVPAVKCSVSSLCVSRCSCSSVKLWCGIVIAGYGSGQIRLYDALSGVVHAEVNAHARWIYALDIAPDSGKVGRLSACPKQQEPGQ